MLLKIFQLVQRLFRLRRVVEDIPDPVSVFTLKLLKQGQSIFQQINEVKRLKNVWRDR